MSLILLLASTAASASEPDTAAPADVRHVQKGWTTDVTGYFFTEEAGRDTLEALIILRSERDTYRAAVDDIVGEVRESNALISKQVEELKAAQAEEREAWEAALKAEEKKHRQELAKAKRPGIGIFGGISFSGEAVIGVGLVWRIF